jgi:low temperature requirement protein LtrA
VTQARPFDLLRERAGVARVTNVELTFDLVFVFAVTQLSDHLLHRPTLAGALQTALLLGMVWLAWAYTAWVTNWLDPERIPVRLLLFALAAVSLVMSAALPTAFGRWGIIVGGAYATMQIGRSICKQYAAAIPGAEFHVIPNAGHLPQIEAPEPLLTLFGQFTGDANGVKQKEGRGYESGVSVT